MRIIFGVVWILLSMIASAMVARGMNALANTSMWTTITEASFEEALRTAIPIIFFFAVLVGGLLVVFKTSGSGERAV